MLGAIDCVCLYVCTMLPLGDMRMIRLIIHHLDKVLLTFIIHMLSLPESTHTCDFPGLLFIKPLRTGVLLQDQFSLF